MTKLMFLLTLLLIVGCDSRKPTLDLRFGDIVTIQGGFYKGCMMTVQDRMQPLGKNFPTEYTGKITCASGSIYGEWVQESDIAGRNE
jgi:hypothetical protein